MTTERMEVFEELQKLINESKELGEKLEKSLLIQKLWPEAFQHGRAYSYFEGGSIVHKERFKDVKFVIQNNLWQTKEFEIKDVPIELIERLIDLQQAKCRDKYLCRMMDQFLDYAISLHEKGD